MLFYKLFSSFEIMGTYFKTLSLNISASRQNIKNLSSDFGAIHVRIMHADFQAPSFNDMGGEWGDRQTDMCRQAFLNRSLYKISKLPPSLYFRGDKNCESPKLSF